MQEKKEINEKRREDVVVLDEGVEVEIKVEDEEDDEYCLLKLRSASEAALND